MAKILRTVLLLSIAALFLPACSSPQRPSPSDTLGNGYGTGGSNNGDIIPDGMAGDYGLEARGAGEGIANGKYNGRDMVEGLLPSVYFGFDSSSISAAERGKLQQAADYLKGNPAAGLLIEGHCDWYGTAEYNLALGERRANSAGEYIKTLGINASRIETLSKGNLESTPGLPKAQSFQDRRADLIILK